MASKGGLLSDMQLKQWIKAGKPISASDGGGLLFTLSAAGNAAWVLRYRYGNQRPEMTLGPYPAIGLSEARAMALIKRAEIAQGKNPMAERRKAKAALAKDWTVRQLIKDYREKILVTLAKSTKVCYSRHLKRIKATIPQTIRWKASRSGQPHPQRCDDQPHKSPSAGSALADPSTKSRSKCLRNLSIKWPW